MSLLPDFFFFFINAGGLGVSDGGSGGKGGSLLSTLSTSQPA